MSDSSAQAQPENEPAPAMDLDAIIDAHQEKSESKAANNNENYAANNDEHYRTSPTLIENVVDAGKTIGGAALELGQHPDVQKAVVAEAGNLAKKAEQMGTNAVGEWTLERAVAKRKEALIDQNSRMRILWTLWNQLDAQQQRNFVDENRPMKQFLTKAIKFNLLPGLGFMLEVKDYVKSALVTNLPIPTQALRAWYLGLDDFQADEVMGLIAAGVLDCKDPGLAKLATERYVKFAKTAGLGASAVKGVGKVAGVAGKVSGQAEVDLAGKGATIVGRAGEVLIDFARKQAESMNAIRAEVQKIQPEPETVEGEVAEERGDVAHATEGVYPPVIEDQMPEAANNNANYAANNNNNYGQPERKRA